jgi:hypothetical protein
MALVDHRATDRWCFAQVSVRRQRKCAVSLEQPLKFRLPTLKPVNKRETFFTTLRDQFVNSMMSFFPADARGESQHVRFRY